MTLNLRLPAWRPVSILVVSLLLTFSGSGAAVDSEADAPAHDAFENARPVEALLPYADHATTVGATVESGELLPCGDIGATVWYAAGPLSGAAGFVAVDTLGSDFDTVLAVYRGTSLGSLELVECNDNALGEGDKSRVVFSALPGETYYFQVGGHAGDTGSLQLNVQGLVPATPLTQ